MFSDGFEMYKEWKLVRLPKEIMIMKGSVTHQPVVKNKKMWFDSKNNFINAKKLVHNKNE